MIHLLFNTYEHTLDVTFLDTRNTDRFERVTTIKTHEEGYYEVLQRQNINEKNAPLFRNPNKKKEIRFIHE